MERFFIVTVTPACYLFLETYSFEQFEPNTFPISFPALVTLLCYSFKLYYTVDHCVGRCCARDIAPLVPLKPLHHDIGRERRKKKYNPSFIRQRLHFKNHPQSAPNHSISNSFSFIYPIMIIWGIRDEDSKSGGGVGIPSVVWEFSSSSRKVCG